MNYEFKLDYTGTYTPNGQSGTVAQKYRKGDVVSASAMPEELLQQELGGGHNYGGYLFTMPDGKAATFDTPDNKLRIAIPAVYLNPTNKSVSFSRTNTGSANSRKTLFILILVAAAAAGAYFYFKRRKK